MLVLRRLHVRLELAADAAHRETAERVHGVFAMACPLYRSLRAAIAITTELVLVDGGGLRDAGQPTEP